MITKFKAAKAAIVKDGKMLFLKKARFELGRALKSGIDIPGGRLKEGEDPKEALKREVKEETGLNIRVIRKIMDFDVIKNDKAHVRADAFLCEVIGSDKITLSDEHSSAIWKELRDSDSELDGWLVDVFKKIKEEYEK
ncbi:MAG: NUDIX hydrolase [Nanoarchaeota archaeon]|nr:NUDIX hydrolase [Nanoarchaeota archaeon]